MIIKIILMLILAITIYLYFETNWVAIKKGKLDIPLQSELHYVHISDIHGKTRFINGVLSKKINDLKPDFVLVTGDYSNKQKSLFKVISELSQINSKIIMVLGNYEREELVNLYKKRSITLETLEHEVNKYSNIRLLVNEEEMIHIGGTNISIYGFDNSVYGNESYAISPTNMPIHLKLLLAHSPNIVHYIKHHNIDYNHLLVGHTHGKQINLPVFHSSYDHFHIGTKQVANHKYFSITSGLGTVKLPFRLGVKPVIDYYTVSNEE